MIKIIFQKKQDAMHFHHQLINRLPALGENHSILLEEDQNRVSIPGQMCKDQRLNEIKDCFYSFITTTKRDDWFRSILLESYFYTDEEEQDQIMDIIYSVLEGDRQALLPFMEGFEEEEQIRRVINEIFDQGISFSFDSFVMFRLKSYYDCLIRWIEVAIDEYKMEQEYQVFICMLREFLAGRRPRMPLLHLVIDENMGFYDSDFIKLRRDELFEAIDRRLLVNHPVYVDSLTIAPMLSIAPEVIHLYTDDLQQPLVRTILNIFEERVNTRPLSMFQVEKMSFQKTERKNVQ